MPVYNSEKYLNESIKSVLEQTFDNFEFIIINDGSTDKSENIIKHFQKQDRRIILYNQENQGITKSLNKGIKNSKGKYIARMDADDICHLNRFKTQIEWIQDNKDYDIIGSQVEFINEDGIILKSLHHLPLDDYLIKWELIFGTPLMHPTLLIRRSIFEYYGLYDEKYLFAQDLAFWRKIARNSKFSNVPQKLFQIRLQKSFSKNKIIIQNDVRLSTIKAYIKRCCGISQLNNYEAEFSEFLSSGHPVVKKYYRFFKFIKKLKDGFIKENCDTQLKIENINYHVSKLFLRAVLVNSNNSILQTQLLISSIIFFPFIIIKKIFWWHLKQIVFSYPKEASYSR